MVFFLLTEFYGLHSFQNQLRRYILMCVCYALTYYAYLHWVIRLAVSRVSE